MQAHLRIRGLIILLTVQLLAGSVAWGASLSTIHLAASIDGFRLPFEGGPYSIVQGPSCPGFSHAAVPEAIDFVMPEGTHLVAVQSGKVIFAAWDGDYGNQVRVEHDNGLISWYSHIQPNGFRVSVGDRVVQGQLIALSGNTGYSTGSHLHFEIRRDAWNLVPIDGLPGISWNAERGGRCTGSATGEPVETPNQPPNKPSLIAPADGSVTNSSSVKLEWKDNGDPDGKQGDKRDYYIELYRDGQLIDKRGWKYFDISWTLTNLSSGSYTWRVNAGDGDLSSGWTSSWRFTVDTVAPTGSFTLNYGWETANSVRVPLNLTASDQQSGVKDMRLGHTCSSLGSWQPFQSRLWWQLSGQHGDTARVCAQFRDRAGNLSSTVERSTRLDFYPAQPSSASYRLHSDVSAISGEPHQSSSYRLNSTAGQALASGAYATSSSYRAALGFWPRIHQSSSPPSTNQPPRTPTLLSPATGSTSNTATPTLTWQNNDDPDNSPQPMRFRVSMHSLDGTQVAESGWLNGTSWTPPALADGTYQWRVQAFDGADESAWTGVWSLTIKTSDTPSVPYFISDYTLGGPGSTFVFTAGHFPAGAQTTLSIREPGMSTFRTLVRMPIPDTGTLVFVVPIPTSAAPGVYTVRIAVNGVVLQTTSSSPQASLVLEQAVTIVAEEPVHTDKPPDGAIVVDPFRSDASRIYLPLVVR